MNYREQSLAQGYLSPLDIIDAGSAARHRQALETAETEFDPTALAWRESLQAIHHQIAATG